MTYTDYPPILQRDIHKIEKKQLFLKDVYKERIQDFNTNKSININSVCLV